jgi:integrase
VAKRRSKGEGSIWYNESDGRWKAQITLPDGKRRGKSAKTQKDVRDWLIQQRNQVKEGLYVADDQLRVGTYLDRYLENVSVHQLRPRTYNRHYDLVNKHIKPEIGNIRLNALSPGHVQSLYTRKLDQGLSKRSVQYIHAVLHKALNQALKWGLVVRNVTDLVEKPKPDKKVFKTWSVEEVNLFLYSVQEHRWYPIYMLAIYTGLRQGELLGIHREDIDLGNGILHVRHQISAIRGQGLTISEPKTDKARRAVTLPPSARDTLAAYLSERGDDPGLIFTTSTGNPISPRNLLRHFKRAINENNLSESPSKTTRITHW